MAIALDAHDKWLKQSLADSTVWASQDNNTYRGVYVLGFLSSISYLIFAVIMIVCMKAVMKDSSSPTPSSGTGTGCQATEALGRRRGREDDEARRP